MQATITEWMFVCITIRTLSYPQRCSLPPFLPPFPLLPLLSLPLPIFGPLSIFFFLCSLSFLCPSLSLLLLLLLPSQGPFYPSADSSGSSVPPPSSLSSYTSVSLPLFPSSALSFRFFTPFLHFTLLPLLSCPSYASTAPSPSSAPLLLPFPLLHLLPLLSLFIPFLLPILPLPYLLFLLPLFLCWFFFLIVLSFVSSLYSKTRLITQTSRIRDAIYKPHEGT